MVCPPNQPRRGDPFPLGKLLFRRFGVGRSLKYSNHLGSIGFDVEVTALFACERLSFRSDQTRRYSRQRQRHSAPGSCLKLTPRIDRPGTEGVINHKGWFSRRASRTRRRD